MKNNILILSLLLWSSICSSVYAQRGQENVTPESKANKVATHLQHKLSLSDEQRDKIYELNLHTIKETRSLKVAKRNDVSGLKEGYMDIHKQYDDQMKTILSAEQYTSWKQIQTDARARKEKELQEENGKKSKFTANESDPEEEMTWEESD